ncbi:hypothetical protein [Pseudomonas reactans]
MSGEINLPVCEVNNVRANLDPPYVNNAIRTVDGAEIGAGIDQIKHGLYVIFERWANLNAGDQFEFYMGDAVPIASDEVLPSQSGQPRFYLHIALDEIPRGFTWPCYGVVRRAGGGATDRSVEQTWFVRDERPGGVDTDPGVPYHPQLQFSLPLDLQAPDAVLDPARAEQGVVCTIKPYPNMRIHDTIVLEWNDEKVTVELRLDKGHLDGTKPIEVFVTPDIIERGGSGLLGIRFRVVDEVLNGSGPLYPWSATTHLQSDLDPNLLDRPYFLVDGVEDNDVDLDTQGDGPFEIEVVTPAFLPDGSPTPVGTQIVVTLSPTRQLPPVTARIGRSVFIPVDKAFIRELLNSSTLVSYALQFPLGNEIGVSRQLRITVSGTASNMPVVHIVQSQGGVIDPEEPSIRVEFPEYEPYGEGYNVTLVIEDETGQVIPFEQTRLAGPRPPPTRFRTVTQAEFLPFVGLPHVYVYYRVDDGVTSPLVVRESERLPVQFGTANRELPAARIAMTDQHDNLDPEVLVGHATVTLPYVLTMVGDLITWSWIGSESGGSTRGEIRINSGTVGRPLEFDVDRLYVDKNLNGDIRLSYFLERDGSPTLRSEVLRVTVGAGLGELFRPEVWEASQAPDELAPEAAVHGATIVVSYLSMLETDEIRACWKGLPGIGSHCETKNGSSLGRVEFTVPSDTVGFNIQPPGRDISVQYVVLRRGRETPSPILHLHLLPIRQLPTPILEKVGENQVLELFNFDGLERTRMVPWLFAHAAQYMWLEFMGTFEDESAYFESTYDGNLVGQVATEGVATPAPVDKILRLLDGSELTICFWCNFGRNPDKSTAVVFGVRHYRIQALPMELPYPTVATAVGSESLVTLNPLNVVNGADVIVAYTPMSTQHTITLVLTGRGDEGSVTLTLPGEADGSVLFRVGPAIIAANLGNDVSTFTVQYSVVIGTFDPIPSGVLTVMLSPLPAANRPAVIIKQADAATKVLELSNVLNGGMVRASTWSFIAVGQPVYLRLEGTGNNGLPHHHQVWTFEANAVTSQWVSNGFFEAAVPASYFKDLKHDSPLTTVFRVIMTPGVSPPREFVEFEREVYTIADATERPVITSARDDGANLIVDGGITVAIAVTLRGTAAPLRDVDIYDGAIRRDKATANPQGIWELRVTGLSQGLRRFTARALYGNPSPISAQYSFTVANSVRPTIAVFDSRGEVLNNGMTTDTRVTLSGVATARLQVQLYEDGRPSVVLPVNPQGQWSHVRDGLLQRTYSFRVRALYANLESGTRSFTVNRAVPFSFNTATVVRNQRLYLWRDLTTNPAYRPRNNADTFQHRASGGREPYTYTSSNTACAVVDGNGVVVIRNNGTARITCRDADGTSLGYNVQVSNVVFFRDYGTGGSFKTSSLDASSRGGRLASLAELRGIFALHGGSGWRGQGHLYFWSTDGVPFIGHYVKHMVSEGESRFFDISICATLVVF